MVKGPIVKFWGRRQVGYCSFTCTDNSLATILTDVNKCRKNTKSLTIILRVRINRWHWRFRACRGHRSHLFRALPTIRRMRTKHRRSNSILRRNHRRRRSLRRRYWLLPRSSFCSKITPAPARTWSSRSPAVQDGGIFLLLQSLLFWDRSRLQAENEECPRHRDSGSYCPCCGN